MEIPDESEIARIKELSDTSKNGEKDPKLMDPLKQLSDAITEGKYRYYMLGDLRKIYMVKKVDGKLNFVKSILVTPSVLQYSNKVNSGGTPLGMHRIGKGKNISYEGLLGEVVSVLNPHKSAFQELALNNGGSRTFSRHLDGRDTYPEMITARLLLIGPDTPMERGANLHGTNYQNKLGERDSSGCARMSNVAIASLFEKDEDSAPYVEEGKLIKNREGWEILGGTPLMIYATPKDRGIGPNGEKPVQHEIPSWFKELNSKGQKPTPETAPIKIPDWFRKLNK
jgi:hypothetical protein